MERYLADVMQEGAEAAPVLMAYGVEAETPEQARQLALLKAPACFKLSDPPDPTSLRVRLFAQERLGSQRWIDIDDPRRFKLLAPAPKRFAAASVCFHSEWSRGSALFICDLCLGMSYPGTASSGGDAYHRLDCARQGTRSAGCTLHIGPELAASLLASGGSNDQDVPLYRAGNLTARMLRQLFPELAAGEQSTSRSAHHRAVVSMLMESRGDKLRDVARVVFPDGSEQEGSIWRLHSGWYSALVGGVWLLLEYPADEDAARERADIERWVIKRDKGGRPMFAPSF